MARFSIVIPSLNSGRFIETALRSVIAQRDGFNIDLELLVMDGGSNDNTRQILERYRSDITHLVIEPDGGPASAINKGLSLASGEILAWLNADDLYHPGALRRVADAFRRQPQRALCFGHCRIVNEEGDEIRGAITKCKECCFPFACRPLIQTLNFVSQPALFFTRQALERAGALREDLKAAFDYEFLLRLWRQGGAVRLQQPPLADFRWHTGSISGGHFERQFQEELDAAANDAGRWAPQTWLHRLVRYTIVSSYRAMARRRVRQSSVPAKADVAMPSASSHAFHLGVNSLFLIPGQVGGSETYLIELLRAILPIHKGRITLFTNRENDSYLRTLFGEALHYELLNFEASRRAVRILREQFELPRRVRQSSCDLLWSPGYTAPLRLCCPQVVNIHDMQYRRHPSDLTPLAWLATHLLVSAAARHCQGIIAISHFTASEIEALTQATLEKIHVAHCGVNVAFGMDDSTANGVAPNQHPYLLSVAASYPHKNLPLLVKAFDMLASEIPHNLVLIGGEGLDERNLKRAIAEAHFGSRIQRRRGLTRAELVKSYRRADLFVLPSLYEGFGLPLLEAMAAGTLVLTTRYAAIPEIAGKAALYFDPVTPERLATAIRETLALPPAEKAARLESACAHAHSFTWQKCASETLRVMNHTLRVSK